MQVNLLEFPARVLISVRVGDASLAVTPALPNTKQCTLCQNILHYMSWKCTKQCTLCQQMSQYSTLYVIEMYKIVHFMSQNVTIQSIQYTICHRNVQNSALYVTKCHNIVHYMSQNSDCNIFIANLTRRANLVCGIVMMVLKTMPNRPIVREPVSKISSFLWSG